MKRVLVLFISVILCVGLIAGCTQSGENGDKKSVKLGYVNWSEGIAMTNLVAAILEDKMGYDVEMTLADVAPLFTSIASGDTDIFLDTWLPVTHESYMEKYGKDMEDLGTINENARIGLVVPAYVDINSIDELNAKKADFEGKIIGIDSGAGIMSTTEKAIQEYSLDFELMAGSGPTMTAALKKAIDAKKPIVVTGWSPHWKFARWELKFLDDSKGIYGAAESIHKVTRKGLSEDQPEVGEFLKKFKLADDELGDLMGAIEDSDKDPLEVARTWMNEHEDLVNSWIK